MNFMLLAEIALKRIKPLGRALSVKKALQEAVPGMMPPFLPYGFIVFSRGNNFERVNWLIRGPIGGNDYRLWKFARGTRHHS